MAERAWRDEAVGAGVDRVREVATRLAQRGRAVHRDHREAAALARTRVFNGLAPERLDQESEVLVALGPLVDAESLGRTDDVAAVERGDPESLERSLHAVAEGVEADLLGEDPEEVLVPPVVAGLVGEALRL